MNGRRQRIALGLSPSSVTGLFLLPAGVAVGPHGLGLLSKSVLSYLDPAVPVALAAVGILVGLELAIRRPLERDRSLAAGLESVLTIVLVGAAVRSVYFAALPPSGLTPWLLALALGICASTSSMIIVGDADGAGPARSTVELDNVLPIVVGGVALAFVREGSIVRALWLTTQASGVFVIIAIVGWLLITRSSSEREQRVFALAGLLLVGGAAEYLSLSALLAGLIAGLFWGVAGGSARDRIHHEVLRVQHPLLVFVLLVAGARVDFSAGLLGLAVIYVVLRTTGKLAGAWVAGRLVPGGEGPRNLGAELLAPGIVGVGFALNVLRAVGPDAAPVLAVVVAGTFGSELVWVMVRKTDAVME